MSKVLTFDHLTEIIRLSTQEGLSQLEISLILGCGKSTIGDFLRRESHPDFWDAIEEKPVASGTIESIHEKRQAFTGKRYVFTSAQNNTFVHDKFLKSLELYCAVNDCELIVGTFHYNKNAYQKGDYEDSEHWFDPKIRKYILDEDRLISKDLMWCGSLDVIPTAANPLSGFHSYTMERGGIVPHAKVQLESLPTPKFDDAKIMYTTGTVTQQNYIERKAGQIASFHHVFGALVVEVDEDGDTFPRQLIADSDTGEFCDLDNKYTPKEVISEICIEAINWGDVHSAKVDPLVAACSWGIKGNSMLDILRPDYQFVHDVFDMQYRNHHNIGNPYFKYKMFIDGTESVSDEIVLTTNIISDMIRGNSEVIIVQSNHDLALKKWLTETDYKNDPVNAEFFLEMQLATYKAIKKSYQFDVFEYACKQANDLMDLVRFLREDESFVICENIECGQHGHNGNNGARGGVRAFQIQGRRFNTGHTHAAGIKDGVYTAGVSGKLDMGYNIGGSSWSNSHILTYKSGKRAIITIKNGKWRG